MAKTKKTLVSLEDRLKEAKSNMCKNGRLWTGKSWERREQRRRYRLAVLTRANLHNPHATYRVVGNLNLPHCTES